MSFILSADIRHDDDVTRFTYDYEGEMAHVATDRRGLTSGVEIYVNIARMLFETLEGQVFKVRKKKYRWRCVSLPEGFYYSQNSWLLNLSVSDC